MGAKTRSTSFQGPFTREDGFLGYNEICAEEMEQDNPWTVQWDEHYRAPFMYKGVKWISYDNEQSIAEKSHFAHEQGLAGVMVWSIDTDDFRGDCGGPKFPLLRTINHALHRAEMGVGAGAAAVSEAHVATLLSVVGAAIVL